MSRESSKSAEFRELLSRLNPELVEYVSLKVTRGGGFWVIIENQIVAIVGRHDESVDGAYRKMLATVEAARKNPQWWRQKVATNRRKYREHLKHQAMNAA